MDFTTGEPSEEALASFIKSLIEFILEENLIHSVAELEAVSG